MTSNEPPANNNDDGFQQLSFFAAPSNSDAESVDDPIESKPSEEKQDVHEAIEAKAAIATDELATEAKLSEPAKKTRAKSKIVKPASTSEREEDTAALTEAKEELAKLPAVAISLPASNANDSRRTVIMNVTEPELKIDFEASLAELETVVKELDGEVKLEKALQLFEQGIKLSVECEQFIKGAEAKIEILKKQADGSLATEVFQGERVDLDD
ncbi:MAG: exodeoxyribonuclease VII small subunit [Candidatus Obscuribacterales bacterium]